MGHPDYLEALKVIHQRLRPRRYLEIGVRRGDSLACASAECRSIAIDPEYSIGVEIACEAQLERMTSDDYFATIDPTEWLEGPVDLGFIDGMHLAEFGLRDFINLERHCREDSVIVFDDMFPRSTVEAQRNRTTVQWAGDVYKIRRILMQYRPDLVVIGLDTSPTGMMIVTGLDPGSRVLEEVYADLERELIEEVEELPIDVLRRDGAVNFDDFVDSGILDAVARARLDESPSGKFRVGVRAEVRHSARALASSALAPDDRVPTSDAEVGREIN